MIIQRQSEHELRPDQVRAMAHGLYWLAQVDGIEPKEKELIEQFLREGSVEIDLDSLAKIPFSLEELVYALDTRFLRKTFLRICVLLCQVDGEISEQEKTELRRVAQAVGVDEPLDTIIADLGEQSLE